MSAGPAEGGRATDTARLAICDLKISLGHREVVSITDLRLDHAEIVGLAGESGSGKSMTTLAILGLAHTIGASVTGSIRRCGCTVLPDPKRRTRPHRRCARSCSHRT